jgi:Ni/Co efflux regulator RcnB
MIQRLMSALVATAVIAMPLSVMPSMAQAKTEKQMRDEHKGKVAKEKSAAKSEAKKSKK